MIMKRKNQENIINFLNGIEKTNNKENIENLGQDFPNLKTIPKESQLQHENIYIDENNIEIDRKVFNANLNEIPNTGKSNINMKKLKIENFEQKIQNSIKVENLKPPLDKQAKKTNNQREIKNTRMDKIKNFIQGITNITNKNKAEKAFEKKDINRSVNYKEKIICEFELDSDYDMFLGKPLTDREERDRLNTILDQTGRVINRNKDEDYYQNNNVETSYRYEEGESREINERIGINNFYNDSYNKMEHLNSDRNLKN